MNCESCQLKELVLEPLEIREVLRCILHTIVFHRALGLVRPKDIDCQLFEITYVQCEDVELEKKIEEKIDQFICWVEKHPNKKSQVTLSFYEVKNKNQAMWFPRSEHLYWERWYINLHVVSARIPVKFHHSKTPVEPGQNDLEESCSRRAALESSLREVLFQIIKFVNEKKDHIPSVQNSEVISFPYEITIPRFVPALIVDARVESPRSIFHKHCLFYFARSYIFCEGTSIYSPGDIFFPWACFTDYLIPPLGMMLVT